MKGFVVFFEILADGDEGINCFFPVVLIVVEGKAEFDF